ncbi:hypothetical protein, partial [uncultured Thermomonospora sp.]
MISARQAITMGTSVAAVTAVLSALPTASAASIGRPADCHLRGQNYAEGAVFYPRENGTGWVCRNGQWVRLLPSKQRPQMQHSQGVLSPQQGQQVQRPRVVLSPQQADQARRAFYEQWAYKLPHVQQSRQIWQVQQP